MSTQTAPVLDCDVAVVGFGPVGATLAGLLAARGVRTIAIDREIDLYPLPRAAHVDHEILRIVQELGCADEMLAAMRPNPGMDFLNADRKVLLSMRSPGLTPLGWPASVFINQPLFEHQLRAAVTSLGADIRLGVGAAAINDEGDHVRITLDDGSSITAAFAVGCDGARSFVRNRLGIELDDLDFEEPWLVVDLIVSGDAPELPDHALQVCDPARPHTLVPMPEPRFRFEFMLLPGEDAAAMRDPAVVESLIAPWIPAGAAQLERSAVYSFHGLIAKQWRSGRVFLAGDAAHQTPPFLGQGMCSGMRDAANLAWKLAAVVVGASDALLDTYQIEREPHVRYIIDAAVAFGQIICTLDPEIAAARDRDMLSAPASASDARGNEGVPMPALTGPLAMSGGGRPAVQPLVNGCRLDAVIGLGWAVVARSDDALTGLPAAWWSAHGAVMLSAATHPELVTVLDHVTDAEGCPADVIVIRPDRYVLGGAAHLDQLTEGIRPILTP